MSSSKLSKKKIILLSVRLALGFPAWLMVLYSVTILPIGVVQTIQNLIPFMTLLASLVLLGEKIRVAEFLSMVVSFIGILLLVQISSEDGKEGSTTLGLLACILSSIFLSLVNVIMRKLRDVHYVVAAGFQSKGTLIASIVALLIYRLFFTENSFNYSIGWTEAFLLLINGIVNSFAQLSFVRAFQLAKAARVSSLQFSSIVFGYAGDMLFFSYSLKFWEVLGSVVVVGSSMLMFILNV